MHEDPTRHYTINMQTHYTVQYKDKDCTWVGDVGEIKYYNSIAEADSAIREAFIDGRNYVEYATIIEWKKTPIAGRKNNKQFIESTACYYDVEILVPSQDVVPSWKVRSSNFESLDAARNYIKETTSVLLPEKFRIVKRETTSKHSVVE